MASQAPSSSTYQRRKKTLAAAEASVAPLATVAVVPKIAPTTAPHAKISSVKTTPAKNPAKPRGRTLKQHSLEWWEEVKKMNNDRREALAEAVWQRQLGLPSPPSSEEEEDEIPLHRRSKKPESSAAEPMKQRPVRKMFASKLKALLEVEQVHAPAEQSALRPQRLFSTSPPSPSAHPTAESSPPPQVSPSSSTFTTYRRKLGKRKREEATTAAPTESTPSPQEFYQQVQQAKLLARSIAQEFEARAIAAAAIQEEIAEKRRAEEQLRVEREEKEKEARLQQVT